MDWRIQSIFTLGSCSVQMTLVYSFVQKKKKGKKNHKIHLTRNITFFVLLKYISIYNIEYTMYIYTLYP